MAAPVVQNRYNHNCDIIKKSDPNQTEVYSCVYSPYSKHRDGDPDKSQWSDEITQDKEFELFKYSISNEWVKVEKFNYKRIGYRRLLSPNGRGWGLYLVDGELKELGTLKDRKTKVTVCVFEEGNPNLWHGYPANFKNRQDRPLDNVLDKWREASIIQKPDMRKIKQGMIVTL